ncbi:MAG TPA: hypothetical protein VGX23_18675 [Actinocrinis sp.]|nr:hypothetical protein [Actinocrinis sp.]
MTANPKTQQPGCPTWCDSGHGEADRPGNLDTCHVAYGSGIGIADGERRSLEILVDLACSTDENGELTTPYVHVHTVGVGDHEIRAPEDVDKLLRELTQVSADLWRWRGIIAASTAAAANEHGSAQAAAR